MTRTRGRAAIWASLIVLLIATDALAQTSPARLQPEQLCALMVTIRNNGEGEPTNAGSTIHAGTGSSETLLKKDTASSWRIRARVGTSFRTDRLVGISCWTHFSLDTSPALPLYSALFSRSRLSPVFQGAF